MFGSVRKIVVLSAAVLLTALLPSTAANATADDPGAAVRVDVRTGAQEISELPRSMPDLRELAPGSLAAKPVAAAPNQTVGRLYFQGGECTASVLTAPRHDLIITAGHCAFEGDGTETPYPGLYFVPGYSPTGSPSEPYGRFPAKSAVTLEGWRQHGFLDWDVAIIQLGPNAKGQNVGDAVGSWNGLMINQPLVADRTVWGYRLDDTQQVFSGSTDRFVWPSSEIRVLTTFEGGSSGGPWLQPYGSGSSLGYVNGVISTVADGKTVSPYFDDQVMDMWSLATS